MSNRPAPDMSKAPGTEPDASQPQTTTPAKEFEMRTHDSPAARAAATPSGDLVPEDLTAEAIAAKVNALNTLMLEVLEAIGQRVGDDPLERWQLGRELFVELAYEVPGTSDGSETVRLAHDVRFELRQLAEAAR